MEDGNNFDVEAESSLRYSRNVGLWPYSVGDAEVRIWAGDIILRTDDILNPLPFKVQCRAQTRNKPYWKCSIHEGILPLNELVYIHIRLPERGIKTDSVFIYVGGKKIRLKLYKFPKADEYFWGMFTSEANLKNEPKRLEEKRISIELESPSKNLEELMGNTSPNSTDRMLNEMAGKSTLAALVEVGEMARQLLLQGKTIADLPNFEGNGRNSMELLIDYVLEQLVFNVKYTIPA